jgi:hypothetical protein
MTIATLEPAFFAPLVQTALLRCIVCQRAFDFAAGQTAIVLRHVAYGYDFAHAGLCQDVASAWLFVEPGYDAAAFSGDARRARVLQAWAADGWTAVLPEQPERIVAGETVRFEPLQCWVLLEYSDGSWHKEGILRDRDWADEPGGAEFPEAWSSNNACIDYVAEENQDDPTRRARWAARLRARNARWNQGIAGRQRVIPLASALGEV